MKINVNNKPAKKICILIIIIVFAVYFIFNKNKTGFAGKVEIVEYPKCPENTKNMPDYLCIEGKVYKGITNKEDCLKVNGIPDEVYGFGPVFVCRAEKKQESVKKEIIFKQYSNSKYGFKIDYPISWADTVVYPQNLRTEFHFNNDDFIVFIGKIWRQEKAKLISYDEYIEEFKVLSKEEGSPVSIKGYQGFKFTNPIEVENKKGFNLIFPTKIKNVILEIYYRGNTQDSGLFQIYDRMVSSFEFL